MYYFYYFNKRRILVELNNCFKKRKKIKLIKNKNYFIYLE